MATSPISLRAVSPADRDLLLHIYATTREEELAVVPWGPAEKAAFLRMQFEARERDYTARFSVADHTVVERAGIPIGYFWLHRGANELRILDVALLPEHRGAGIGTNLMSAVIDEARTRRVPVRLFVLSSGAARRLYERLGFTPVGEASIYQLMELAS